MEVNITKKETIESADFGWGSLSYHPKWEILSVKTKEFTLSIKPLKVSLEYVIHRPKHDHNNSPTITWEIPEGGVIDPFPYGSSRNIEGTEATLRVQDDSGHLRMKMLYDYYVWESDMELVIKKREYESLRMIAKNKGIDYLLEHLGIQSSKESAKK